MMINGTPWGALKDVFPMVGSSVCSHPNSTTSYACLHMYASPKRMQNGNATKKMHSNSS